jgi:hypothetical protein
MSIIHSVLKRLTWFPKAEPLESTWEPLIYENRPSIWNREECANLGMCSHHTTAERSAYVCYGFNAPTMDAPKYTRVPTQQIRKLSQGNLICSTQGYFLSLQFLKILPPKDRKPQAPLPLPCFPRNSWALCLSHLCTKGTGMDTSLNTSL